MANRNVFTADITDGQYQKGSYTTPEGNVRTGIHVFTTLSRSKQRVVPMVSTSQRVELSSMNPNSNIAAASDVIAKINGNVFSGGPIGINYEGPDGRLYISASVYNDGNAPVSSYTYSRPK